MIAVEARGVPVRLITEQAQYRLVSRMWYSWNVDRLYMAGVEIRDRADAGLNHQKSVILHDYLTTRPDRSATTPPFGLLPVAVAVGRVHVRMTVR